MRLLCCLTIITLISGSAIAAEGGSKKAKQGGRAAPVVVMPVARVSLAPTVNVSATVVSRDQAKVPAEVTARLAWVAEPGQAFAKGQAVARLDNTLYQLQVTENQAALVREKARLRFIDKDLVRVTELSKRNFASSSEIEKLQVEREVAQSEVRVFEAKLRLAEETLKRYQVNAPFDGVVVERIRRTGEWVKTGDTVLQFSNPDALEIEANVAEVSVPHIRRGTDLQVLREGNYYPVTVHRIVPVGDKASLLYDLRLRVKGAGWRAGQSVRLSVPTGPAREVLAIPRDALVLRSDGASVYRISNEQKAEKLGVQTGIASGDKIQIHGSLKEGDLVVIRGSERLRPGQSVKIQEGPQ